MATFAWNTIHYPTLDAYRQALLPFPKPAWITGITIHHSYRPTRAQWHGHVTMEGTRQYYINKGWTSGPHLFLTALTPGPFNDGIWAGTPLAHPGTHAGACNASHIGIEVVGDYDAEPWPAAVAELVYGTVELLMRWGNIPVGQVHGHRECLPNKSCPGSKIDMNEVRAELAHRLDPPPVSLPSALITPQTSFLAPPRATPEQCARYILSRPHGEYDEPSVRSIVASYYAQAAGIDPLLAIAQCIHETGCLSSWWAARPRRNSAGLGVTGNSQSVKPARSAWAFGDDGRWHEGLGFPSWERSASAHLGRLLAYALPAGRGSPAQQELIAAALALRPLPLDYRGSAPTLDGLRGRWAVPGSDYPEKITAVANSIRGM